MLEFLFTSFVVLMVLDAITTYQGMKSGAAEGNPLMRWLFERVGVAPALVSTKAAGIAVVWFTMGEYSVWILAALNVLFGVVVWRNHSMFGR